MKQHKELFSSLSNTIASHHLHSFIARGFTIVELLIVIVIIAILAAITLVSYNGITNKANNSAVQSDLASTYKKLAMYNSEFGTYPTSSDTATLKTIIVASKGSYDTSVNAYVYCRSNTDAAVVGRSKSGMGYYSGSKGSGTIAASAWTGSSATTCPTAGVVTTATGYGFVWAYSTGNGWAY